MIDDRSMRVSDSVDDDNVDSTIVSLTIILMATMSIRFVA